MFYSMHAITLHAKLLNQKPMQFSNYGSRKNGRIAMGGPGTGKSSGGHGFYFRMGRGFVQFGARAAGVAK